MRLIDADEVLKRWGLKFYAMGGDRLGPNGDEISFYVNGLLNEIQNAPTVERPTAKWELYGGIFYKCSNCGHNIDGQDSDNYCCNCGAKMEVEND